MEQLVSVNRGKGLGGTGNINKMICLRGNPKGYDLWAKITNDSSWNYTNMLYYFKSLEEYHGAFEPIDR
jgi:choline dehydrogenase